MSSGMEIGTPKSKYQQSQSKMMVPGKKVITFQMEASTYEVM
jgi:hypothetical protein